MGYDKQIAANARKEAAKWKKRRKPASVAAPGTGDHFIDALKTFDVDALDSYNSFSFNGDKFPGGYGHTVERSIDFDELQLRSGELFRENLYARGLVRRLVTNEITTGLKLESTPESTIIIKQTDEQLEEWSEDVEVRFGLYGGRKQIVDWRAQETFSKIQQQARMEAIVGGDCLVVLHEDEATKLPSIEIIRGEFVRSPLNSTDAPTDNRIIDCVELDSRGRQVGYWVTQLEGQEGITSKRVAAFGARSGRRLAWMIYGTEKRSGEVRGQPLLSLILQSLKEVDRYRDAAQRKAVINSMIAMYIKKTEDKPGTKPISNSAVRKGSSTVTDSDGTTRSFDTAEQIPGLVLETLQQGEEPVGFAPDGTDVNFGPFEEVIIQAVAWANEIPPEILRLSFSNNYSASAAALNEFNIYLDKKRAEFGTDFCQPIYEEWLISEIINSRIAALDLFKAFSDPAQYDIYAAWVSSDWSGAIKPSTDIKKQAQGIGLMVDRAWTTNSRAARQMAGQKWTKNVKKVEQENKMLANAMRPMLELKKEFGPEVVEQAMGNMGNLSAAIEENTEAIQGLIDGEN